MEEITQDKLESLKEVQIDLLEQLGIDMSIGDIAEAEKDV